VTQFLEILHLATYHALVHCFVERYQGLLEEAAQALPHEELREMVLQFTHSMLTEEPHRCLDFAWKRHRVLDRDAEHRLKRRLGERNDRPRAPALGEQLFDQLEPRNLIRGIDTIAEAVARWVRKTVTSLPHVELFSPQTGDADHLADVQGTTVFCDRDWTDDRYGVIAPTRRRLYQDSHASTLPV